MVLKQDVESEISIKTLETTKYNYKYKTNINTIIGNINEEML